MAIESSGYIKLFRKFLEWEWYDDINCKVVFIHLLLKANYREKQWRGKTIKRGQLFTSIESLSSELHLTTKQIRITISKLENTGEIIKNGASDGTYITVCNYDNYQQSEQSEGQAEGEPRASEGQTEGKRGATTNNNKKEKKEEKYKNIPPTIEEIKERMIQRGLVLFTAEAFHAHYSTNGWMVGRTKMKNWDAALTTWNEKSKQYGSNRPNYSGQPKNVNSQW